MDAKRTVTWTIVDGLQRFTALLVFLDNKIPAFGSYFEEYIDKPSYTNVIKFNVNDLQYHKDVLQWYIDMNEGGVMHSKEEINRVKDLLRDCSK